MGFLKNTLDYEKKMLSREKIPNEARDAILNFVDDLQLENISEVRRINYMQRLRLTLQVQVYLQNISNQQGLPLRSEDSDKEI